MRYRRLGGSGLKVSVVSLGSWLTYGNAVDDDATRRCVEAALEAGINLLDTADVYAKGQAEEALGRALEGRTRRHLVLATKCFGTMSDDVNDRGLSRKHIMESCEQSLRRLRTDYIDLYQCHRYDPETPLDEVVAAMSDLVRQGKVLYWGVSCWEPEQLEAACASAERQHGVAPISNQPPYNMLQREIEAEVVPTSARLGIGQVVYSPLAQGLLTGKYLGGAVPEGSRLANDRINKFMKDRVTEANLAKVEALGAIAAELELSLPTLALAWCLREPNVASVIMGATRPEQVAENAAAGDVELEAPVLERIDAILTEGA